MAGLLWQTPNDSENWCDISFVVPADLFPALLETIALMGLPDLWIQKGDLTPEEAAKYFDNIFVEMNQDCEAFLFDEDGFLLTDEDGYDLY